MVSSLFGRRAIYVELRGGLGNQLFQFSCGYALARKYQRDLWLVTSQLARTGVDTPRNFELESFGISNEVARATGIGLLPQNTTAFDGAYGEIGDQSRARFGFGLRVVSERGLSFQPITLGREKNVLLRGYWQSEQYFSELAHELRPMLQSPLPLSEHEDLRAKISEDPNAVCIQVRRGDYVSNTKVRAVHGLLPRAYFLRGLAHLDNQQSVSQVFVFSDDAHWSKKNLNLPFPSTVIDLPQSALQPAHSLALLSSGSRFVISNSSFGWWGAWLSGADGSNIVAPREWFRDNRLDDETLVPPNWVRV